MNRMKPCPICGKPSSEASRPFCSERCRSVDLNRWLSGAYAIPVAGGDDADEGDAFPVEDEKTRRAR